MKDYNKPRYERLTPKQLWELEAQIDASAQHLHKAIGIVRKMLGQASRPGVDTKRHKVKQEILGE